MGNVKKDISTGNLLEALQSTLAAMPASDFLKATKDLLEILGYQSGRTQKLSGSADDFIREFPAPNQNTRTEQEFCEHTQSVQLIFQVTSDEIAASSQPTFDFDAASFDRGQQRSFIFFAVELKKATCARGQYAQFTREINKRLSQPTVVLFKTTDLPAEHGSAQAGNLLTAAFVHRREHKRDPNRDVLGKVSLIREIDPASPHRAHLDILAELSLAECAKWMDTHHRPHNFDGLLAAWLDKLDTEELNRRFYQDLFKWFGRAVKEARFPTDQARTLPSEEHVIRLITRLLFVWFIKEKGLISGDLFVEAQVAGLLRDYDRDDGDSYYRSVLQNLFFATLNTEIDKRDFSKKKNATHRNFSLYRYKREISDPDALRALFVQTPFINGGLFDCLDSEEATRDGGYRVDCFSDNVIDPRRKEYGILSIPNHLFFDDDGLITLLNHYKFTVEENTPIEQEVALDPELLGKVFENLLAAYNPETRDTVRKQTGSYYTPRAVVDYMVDEALVATLEQHVQPADGDAEFWEDRLRYLLDYEDAFDDANELFEKAEAEGIVQVISEIKVLDPAVGSGAFPMGMLHKLTLALRRIDPGNNRWEALQKERARAKADAAFETRDQRERDAELLEISETFQRYSGDFGRKLYLIQNSIFGVDIQPVACQIAKLRFFISLAIEQEADETAHNFGIKPLPNLETRFVAANTLVGLQLSEVSSLLQDDAVQQNRKEIEAIREKYFLANNRPQKIRYIRQEKDCLEQLEQALEDQRAKWVESQQREIERKIAQLPNPEHRKQLREDEQKKYKARKKKFDSSFEDARKITRWRSYDQNAKADWFDTKYMFGIADGFDVVIGNPPYVQLQKNSGELGNLYKDTGYATFARTGDIYQLFCERGCRLLRPAQGLLAYITSNSWLKAEYGKPLRRYFAEQHTPLRLLEMGKDVFENTIVDTSVLLLREGNGNETCRAVDMDKLPTKDFPPDESSWGQTRPDGEKPWSILSHAEQSIMDKMQTKGTPLKDWDVQSTTELRRATTQPSSLITTTKNALIELKTPTPRIIKPVLRGRDIQRYQAQWAGLWLIYSHCRIAEDDYPAVREHLLPYKEQLSKRRGGANPRTGQVPYQWWQLQVDYYSSGAYEDFAKEKLFWMDLTE